MTESRDPEMCPSLLLHDGVLHACLSRTMDHNQGTYPVHSASKPGGEPYDRLTWSDQEAVPTPKGQKPLAGPMDWSVTA